MEVADQAGSLIVPWWPVVLVAFALAKLVLPKLASGSVWQRSP
jgi:hypothetical protein